MKSYFLPFFFFLVTVVLAFLNFLAFMRLLPVLVTLPLLFISIYITLYTFFNRNVFQHRFRHRG